jgi:hypothetical protein
VTSRIVVVVVVVASGKSRVKVEVKKRKMRVKNRRNAFEAGSDIFVAEFGGLRVEAEVSLFIEKKVERGGSNVNKRWPHVIKIRKRHSRLWSSDEGLVFFLRIKIQVLLYMSVTLLP